VLWGGSFWTSGFYLNTVGQYGNEIIIKKFVKDQGKAHKQIYRGQLKLFEDFAKR
jgi:REP-associated tyrosine transposase